MWIRVRLDIGWRDLCLGFLSCLTARNRTLAQQNVEKTSVSGNDDVLACLSVRSGLDLLLHAHDFPHGSEVLYSAITIPDMVSVAKAHELVPVPVDLCGSDFRVDPEALKRAIGPKSKALVIAHLFGARPDMNAVFEVAREHDLVVIEDCAQAWCGVDWWGNAQADANLFSFGAIKTGTALGGAVVRVRDPEILKQMRITQSKYPIQRQRQFTGRVVKFSLLKAISSRIGFGALLALGRLRGKNVDEVIGGLTRGFPDEDLMVQLRQQPCAAMLRLLERRLTTYRQLNIERRIRNARRIIEVLGLEPSYPELTNDSHSFWLFPLQSENPQELITRLRQHGFDSTQYGSLDVIPAPPDRPELECTTARKLLDRTIFLPCYPEMPLRAIDQMCQAAAART